MMVRTAGQQEYFEAFPARTLFGSRPFMDATPAPEGMAVRFFIGCDTGLRPRMGLVAGYDGRGWCAPYSAPFAEVGCRGVPSLEHIYDFISELTTQLAAPLQITLAPPFYDPEGLPRIAGIAGNLASRVISDFNYHYPLERLADYESHLDRAARKNHHRALVAGFTLSECPIPRAYAVIRANRDSHGYPLAMSLERVERTAAAAGAECLVLSLGDADVAAALVYHTAPGIVQVVYWGDVPGYSELRPMNALAFMLFSHYAARGERIVDIGPSSTRGVPNSGLCRFKESLGCLTTVKHTLIF